MRIILLKVGLFIMVVPVAVSAHPDPDYIFKNNSRRYESYLKDYTLLKMPPENRKDFYENNFQDIMPQEFSRSWSGSRGRANYESDQQKARDLRQRMQILVNGEVLRIMKYYELPRHRARFFRRRAKIGEEIDKTIYLDLSPVMRSVDCETLRAWIDVEKSQGNREIDFSRLDRELNKAAHAELWKAAAEEFKRKCEQTSS